MSQKGQNKKNEPKIEPKIEAGEPKFVKAKAEKDLISIVDHNIDAFSDTPDFSWNLEEIKQEIKQGWEVFAVFLNNEIIAAAFLKEEKQQLLTKNTSIKMTFQGSGYSHKIKEFFEKEARSREVAELVHFCRIDNFRMYSLNEGHGYLKTPRKLGPNGELVEWVKRLREAKKVGVKKLIVKKR
jgi:predicted GNAT family acetyltransferase